MTAQADTVTSRISEADSLYIIKPAATVSSTLDTRLDTALIDARPRIDVIQPVMPLTREEMQPAWMSGLEPASRVMQPGHQSGFLMILALMAVVLIYNFRHLSRLVHTYMDELIKVRRGRDNVFDERPAGDTRVLILLITMAIVCCGTLLSTAIADTPGAPGLTNLSGGKVAAVTTVAALYYFALLCGYNLVGYAFTTPEQQRDWVRGYNASQALLGLALVIPATLAIFYPEVTSTVVLISLCIYLAARLLFIFKGFRIFYTNFGSLLYFILYLCTLELIPLIFVYKCSQTVLHHTI
ncbi:MAG: DUF4271 domain-containing protein [Odoribacter sp.]|nr:DUF4271 domain-containing protein [Odoribacter sp.]